MHGLPQGFHHAGIIGEMVILFKLLMGFFQQIPAETLWRLDGPQTGTVDRLAIFPTQGVSHGGGQRSSIIYL